MNDIERKARELLAAEQDQHGRCQTSEALAAIKKALTPPEGYVLVPEVPSFEMLSAAAKARSEGGASYEVWVAMLAAHSESK